MQMLAATASSINCTGGVSGDNPTEITKSDVDVVVRTLLNNSGEMIADNIEGEDRFGTAPVREAYFGLCSTNMTGNLDQLSSFVHKTNYSAATKALRSEWGSCGNLRYVISPLGSVDRNASKDGNDVYNIFCLAKEAYAYVEQDAATAQFIYRPPIYDSALALNATAGYKFASACRITNDMWILKQRATLLN